MCIQDQACDHVLLNLTGKYFLLSSAQQEYMLAGLETYQFTQP